jgi:mono/diheme cytochrome c family protein
MRLARILTGLLAVSGLVGAPAPALAISPDHGKSIFGTYCVHCHGREARGCGPAARLYHPRPANLTASTRSPEYKASIIRGGGQSMGRSPFMPPWGQELSGDDIADIVAFLSTLEKRPAAEC